MRSRLAPILALACVLAVPACKPYRPTATSDEFRNSFAVMNRVQIIKLLAEKQAPMEFECAQADMTFKSPGNPDRMLVTGCGKKATYHFVDTIGWVLNTDIAPYESTQTPAPADSTENAL